MIQWLKSVNQQAKLRGSLIVAARDLLADMDPKWREGAGKSTGDVTALLMQIGLAHIQAVYQGQLEAQNFIRSRKAPLN